MQPTAPGSKAKKEKLTAIEQLLAEEAQEAAKAAVKKAKKQTQKAKKQQQQQQLEEEAEDRKRLLQQQTEEQMLLQEMPQQPLSDEPHLAQLPSQHTQTQQQQVQHQSDGQQQRSRQLPQSSAVQAVTTRLSGLHVAEVPAPTNFWHAADAASTAAADNNGVALYSEQELQVQAEPSNNDKFLQDLFCCPLTKVTQCVCLLLLT